MTLPGASPIIASKVRDSKLISKLMPTHTRCVSSSNVTDDVVLSWTVHLARAHPTRSALSLVLCALACSAGYAAIGPAGALVTAIVLLGSLADFLFPVRYVLTENGASCKMLFKAAEIQWTAVKRCYVDDLGLKISPLGRRSRLEAFRGVYLRFAGNRDEVIAAVRALRGERWE